MIGFILSLIIFDRSYCLQVVFCSCWSLSDSLHTSKSEGQFSIFLLINLRSQFLKFLSVWSSLFNAGSWADDCRCPYSSKFIFRNFLMCSWTIWILEGLIWLWNLLDTLLIPNCEPIYTFSIFINAVRWFNN